MKLSKSKMALAKVINENGGWVDGSWFASQDKVGSDHDGSDVCFYKYEPIFTAGKSMWNSNKPRGCVVSSFKTCVIIKNWHQTVLRREEYYHAYPKADADGWIEWTLDELPVEKGTIIDVKYSDGDELHGAPCGEFAAGLVSIRGEPARAEQFGLFDDGVASIIAYRLHKPDVKPEFCESVMRSIPEPESIDWLCANVTEENKHQHVDAKPTIEQLAQDYRNKLDFANSKQKEADEAKAAADAALGELERAGEALGLLIGISKPDREPELVITDWRDLQVNDVVFVGEYDGYESGEYVVAWLEDSDYDGDYAVIVVGIDGIERCMDTAMEWRFIRRP